MSFEGGGRPKISNAGGGAGGGGMSGEDAEQEAAERNLIRRCIDYHAPAVIDLQSRLYHKACRSHHVRQFQPYLQPHSSHLRLMGLPLQQVSALTNSQLYLTYCAHITRAKNSTPIVCLSWTPGGRRLLTGNHEGEFTLWDGSEYEQTLRRRASNLQRCCANILSFIFFFLQSTSRLNSS
jgi:polyadenylation factor subunit 2